MLAKLRAHLSYANVVSTLCLFILLGGSAYAVTRIDRNSVKSRHIVNSQVKTQDIRANAVRSTDIAAGSVAGSEIASDAVTSGNVADGSLTTRDIASTVSTAMWGNLDVPANGCADLSVASQDFPPKATYLVLPMRDDGVDPPTPWDHRLILDGYGPRGAPGEEAMIPGPVMPLRVCNISGEAVDDARLRFLILGFS